MSQETRIQVQHAERPFPNDTPKLSAYLQSSTVSPGGLFTRTASVAQVGGDSNIYMCTDESITVRYRKWKPQSSVADMGSFFLL